MSYDIRCDICRSPGAMRLGGHLPEGWLWFESRDDETGEAMIAFACSRACADRAWRPGPVPGIGPHHA